jgi:hypothetical protein
VNKPFSAAAERSSRGIYIYRYSKRGLDANPYLHGSAWASCMFYRFCHASRKKQSAGYPKGDPPPNGGKPGGSVGAVNNLEESSSHPKPPPDIPRRNRYSKRGLGANPWGYLHGSAWASCMFYRFCHASRKKQSAGYPKKNPPSNGGKQQPSTHNN